MKLGSEASLISDCFRHQFVLLARRSPKHTAEFVSNRELTLNEHVGELLHHKLEYNMGSFQINFGGSQMCLSKAKKVSLSKFCFP